MEIAPDILDTFPGLCLAEAVIEPLSVTGMNPLLEACREEVIRDTRSRYTLETIRDEPLFRAYRTFLWGVGIDPTKTRPASEALVRRILAGKDLPRINTAVDAYNLASIRTGVPIGAFDADLLNGELRMRFARDGEEFLGLGMTRPLVLRSNQILLVDDTQVIAVYLYRDSEGTRVTDTTRRVRLVACGVPGVGREDVTAACTLAGRYLVEYAGAGGPVQGSGDR